jgi:hypothetical protein
MTETETRNEAIEGIERRLRSVEALIAGRANLNGRQQQAGTHAGSEADIAAELLMLKEGLEQERDQILKQSGRRSDLQIDR